MGKAGDALRQTLEGYGISQNQLAAAMGVARPIVFRWFHSQVDPTAETVAIIVESLRDFEPDAADEFIRLYLGGSTQSSVNEVSITSEQLPESDQLNIGALTRLFADTTNSYKYLFFLSLLDILNRQHFEVPLPISFQEIFVEMLANAWFPHTFFKLSFGTQDMIAQKLDSLDLVIEEPIARFKDTDKRLLRKAIASQDLKDVIRHLRRYVPFRLISPFLESDLKDVSRGKGNQLELAMPAVANRCFDSRKPLYQFDSSKQKDCQAIVVHPDWASYLEQHYSIVRSWVAWEWLIYMQKHNPTTPAIANKLFMPTKRDSLSTQTKYWRLVMRSQKVRCIYSQQIIDQGRFSLDHYLPWSFVAHDHLWNLIPTLPEVNSSKSNNLPADEYFGSFVRLQHLGLTAAHATLAEDKWVKQVETFISELGISQKDDLLSLEKLSNAYEQVIKPLVPLANNQGFLTGWRYLK